MTAAVLRGHGGIDRLEIHSDLPVPKPLDGEVLIRVGAAALNNFDIWMREGVSASAAESSGVPAMIVEFRRIQGSDITVRIVAVGPSRVGERVLVDCMQRREPCRLHLAAMLGCDRDGGFAEYTTVPSENAVAITCELSDAELATFPFT